jgi:hypothetical protein
LIDNEVMAGDPDGAALVLWAAESTRPSRVRLDLKGNRVEAGRVAAFTGRPVPLEVHAQGNRFTFGRGVLRFAGDADSEARRHLVAWHGRDNTYRGAGDWLCLEGRPGGVRCLADWEAWWNAEEPGSREETSSAAASPDR